MTVQKITKALIKFPGAVLHALELKRQQQVDLPEFNARLGYLAKH